MWRAASPTSSSAPARSTPSRLGELIYFFEYACGLSGYLLDVNPFDQPGVEAYKKNMFALLGKARLRGPAAGTGGKTAQSLTASLHHFYKSVK